jgi:hypothetical protein
VSTTARTLTSEAGGAFIQMPGGPRLGDGFGPTTASILVLTLAFTGAIVGVVHGLALVWLERPSRSQ